MPYLTDGIGNGELYIGQVKWSKDYKHTMLFTTLDGSTFSLSKSARNDFMTTNLTLLDNEIIELIKKYEIYFQVSIDGIDSEYKSVCRTCYEKEKSKAKKRILKP